MCLLRRRIKTNGAPGRRALQPRTHFLCRGGYQPPDWMQFHILRAADSRPYGKNTESGVGAGVPDGPKRFWNSMFQNRSRSWLVCVAENLPIEGKFSVGLGRLRAPPVADTASNKEWQNQGDWRVCFAHDDRAADSTVREASPYEHFVGGAFIIFSSVRVSAHISHSPLALSF